MSYRNNNSTSAGKRTWVCIPCQKSFRKAHTIRHFECPQCRNEAFPIPYEVAIPSPKNTKKWRELSKLYCESTSSKQYYKEILNDTFPKK